MRLMQSQQLAECGRCGAQGMAKDIVRDGRNSNLLVLKTCGCYDPDHPQERPFQPSTSEGKARFPIAVDRIPAAEGPVLTRVVDGNTVTLTWTPPVWEGPVPSRYEIFRDDALIMIVPVVTDFFIGGGGQSARTFRDTGLAVATYEYRVEAVTGNPALVPNGGFEDGLFTGWSGRPAQGAIVEHAGAQSGRFCVKLASASGGPNVVSDLIPVAVGQVYRGVAHATRDENNLPQAAGRLAFRLFNSSAALVEFAVLAAPNVAVAARQRLTGDYTVEAGVAFIALDAGEAGTDGGYWYYDDLAAWQVGGTDDAANRIGSNDVSATVI